MDEADVVIRTPMKRLGSHRKLVMFNNMRTQLSEHVKAVEARVEAQASLATELADYYRRRAELETDYSRGLDKLARAVRARRKDSKYSDEEWGLSSVSACWERLADATQDLSKDHSTLSDIFHNRIVPRLSAAADTASRLQRRCRDLAAETHDDLLRVLADLHLAMKTHASLAAEWHGAAGKLRTAARARAAATAAGSKKLKPLDKELHKRRLKHAEAKQKALRARGEYVLCLDAANTTIQKYFADDLSDIIDCMELGYHGSLSRALRMHVSADEGRARSLRQQAGLVAASAAAIDPPADKQQFQAAHRTLFEPPPLLTCQANDCEEEEDMEEEESGCEAARRAEAAARLEAVEARLREARALSAEAVKTLHEAERNLNAMQVEAEDWDVSQLFGAGAGQMGGTSVTTPTSPETPLCQSKLETEDFYLAKFAEYVSVGGRAARLEARASQLRERAAGERAAGGGAFSSPLDTHLAESGRELPLVLTACCRVLQAHGLRHQGVFRVSGSHADISSLRAAFDAGGDPLAAADASDVNSVAGLLKMYLRQLRPPLFPHQSRHTLLRLAQMEDSNQFVSGMREFVLSLPRSAFLVLRYLFAFLSHLSEHSEENMMDAWNLAICWGPTLLPVSDTREQVSRQNLLNELVKKLILQHERVFPQDGPPSYRRRAEPPPPPERTVRSSPVEASEVEAEPSLEAVRETGDGTVPAAPGSRCAAPASHAPAQGAAGAAAADEVDYQADETLLRGSPPARRTPDLVQDLPPGAPPAAPGTPATPAAPASTADTFLAARDTLKRRPEPPPPPPRPLACVSPPPHQL